MRNATIRLPETMRLSQKASGAYFTPDDVAAALVSWVATRIDDRLLDPSCGDGQFLAFHRNAVGIEQDTISARQAVERAPSALVHEGDFFSWASETAERFECAAGNPPFIRYQTFKGEVRARALALCIAQGAAFSGLASSWALFLVATAALLKPDGAMAFVVPAEIGHAPYAAPLLKYLIRSFAKLQVIAVKDKLFPTLSEDCWLLYASGYGGKTDQISLTAIDYFRPSKQLPAVTVQIDVAEWRSIWNRRLRPYLLSITARQAYQETAIHVDSRRLSDFAAVGIGYVSGDNGFFHLRPSEAALWKIGSEYLLPTVRNSRAMPNHSITDETVQGWQRSDDPVLLLRLQRGQRLPPSVNRYLNSDAGKKAREAYKCRVRNPWYVVPDVQVPDFIMSYMSGRSVNLIKNTVGVTCTNSVHSVRIRDRAVADQMLPFWDSPFVRLIPRLSDRDSWGIARRGLVLIPW